MRHEEKSVRTMEEKEMHKKDEKESKDKGKQNVMKVKKNKKTNIQ